MRTASRPAIALLLLCACATAGSETNRPRNIGMSLAEAQAVIADFEKDLAKHDAKDPLRSPKSLEDVTEILKRDQIDLFPAGVEFASHQSGVEAKVLQGQIELAWGEAQLTLADLFAELSSIKQAQLRRLGSSSDEAAKRDELSRMISRQTNIADALTRLASEHVAAGAAIAKKLIDESPNDYLGYRLAADYYRLRGDWAQFDEMVKKIEATNPQSNGLIFLRAMAAIQRDGRLDEGQELLKQALSKDAKFARAQAEVVLTARSIDKKNSELQALRSLNPNHQVVVWVGPHIETAYLRAQ